ncbi:hypothetical protein VNO77_25974 [Canavalia gladiata]|uniref:Uncharacterized protein n=1 Tax=Canavalia gladiata TaxID=3824 RepID=A0AAN9KTG3_CANGL
MLLKVLGDERYIAAKVNRNKTQGLNLSPLFDKHQGYVKRQSRVIPDKARSSMYTFLESESNSISGALFVMRYQRRLRKARVALNLDAKSLTWHEGSRSALPLPRSWNSHNSSCFKEIGTTPFQVCILSKMPSNKVPRLLNYKCVSELREPTGWDPQLKKEVMKWTSCSVIRCTNRKGTNQTLKAINLNGSSVEPTEIV